MEAGGAVVASPSATPTRPKLVVLRSRKDSSASNYSGGAASPIRAERTYSNTSEPSSPSPRKKVNVLTANGIKVGEKAPIGSLASNGIQAQSDSKPPEVHFEEGEVIELTAFVEKKIWIEERIKFLESLPEINPFVAQVSVIGSSFNPSPLPEASEAISVQNGSDERLPTREELNSWFEEQEKIEEDALIFDAGDLERLRGMAKAASTKMLSPASTELLSLTLSTLLLIDTLLSLLRIRSETLDLLALRLEWDAARFQIANEIRAIKSEIGLFVRGKASWEVPSSSSTNSNHHNDNTTTTKEDSSPLATASTLSRRGSASSISSLSISKPTLSRTQRYLLTQILDLDFQSLVSRTTSLQNSLLPSTNRILDRMIDLGSSINSVRAKRKRAMQKSRSEIALNRDDETAANLPAWFLEETDAFEGPMGVGGLPHWVIFAKMVVDLWKYGDNTYHNLRRISHDASHLSTDVSRASLQNPSSSQAATFLRRISSIHQSLSEILPPSEQSIPFPSPHPEFPDQDARNRTIIAALLEEFETARRNVEIAQTDSNEYSTVLDMVQRVDSLKGEMETTASALEALTAQLENASGPDGLRAPDLKSASLVNYDSQHSTAYIANFSSVSAHITESSIVAQERLGTTASLLLALKSTGMDPNLRIAVKASCSRLKEAVQRGQAALNLAGVQVHLLRSSREVSKGIHEAEEALTTLLRDIHRNIEGGKWSTSPKVALNASEGLSTKAQAIQHSFTAEVISPLNGLKESFRDSHPHIYTYLEDRSLKVGGMLKQAEVLLKTSEVLWAQRFAVEQFNTGVETLLRSIIDAQYELDSSNYNQQVEGSPGELTMAATISSLTTALASFEKSSSIPMVSSKSNSDLNLEELDEQIRTLSNNNLMSLHGALHHLETSFSTVPLLRLNTKSISCFKSASEALDELETFLSDPKWEEDFKSSSDADIHRAADPDLHRLQLLLNDGYEQCSKSAHAHIKNGAQLLNQIKHIAHVDSDLITAPLSITQSALEDRTATTTKLYHQLSRKLTKVEERSTAVGKSNQSASVDDAVNKINHMQVDLEAPKKVTKGVNGNEGAVDGKTSTTDPGISGMMGSYSITFSSDDVFGPNPSMPTPSGSIASVKDHGESFLNMLLVDQITFLHQQLASLDIDSLANPPPQSLSCSAVSSLPSSDTCKAALSNYNKLINRVKSLAIVKSEEEITAKAALQALIDREIGNLSKLSALSSVSDHITSLDSYMSDMLEQIDEAASPITARRPDNNNLDLLRATISERVQRVEIELAALKETAVLVKQDHRVRLEVKRVKQTWFELHDMAQELLDPKQKRRASLISVEETSDFDEMVSGLVRSASSMSISSLRAPSPALSFQSSAAGRPIMPLQAPIEQRKMGIPRPRLPSTPGRTNGNTPRAVSGPASIPSPHPSQIPTPVRGSIFPRRLGETPSSIPRSTSSLSFPSTSSAIGAESKRRVVSARQPSSLSVTSSTHFATIPRSSSTTRFLSLKLSSAAQAPRQKYVPKQGSKLDRAFAKIINSMPTDIPVAPVAHDATESGKYWIGGPPNPRLCFCRILRSKTVMVRVGGGWSELSKFLRDHFAIDLIPSPQKPFAASPEQNIEPWIRGGSVPPATPSTPMRKSLSLSPELSFITPTGTSKRPSHLMALSPGTPQGGTPRSAGEGSPNSPMVQLGVLMRKADDSPSSVLATTPGHFMSPAPNVRSSNTYRMKRDSSLTSLASSSGTATQPTPAVHSRPPIPWR